MGDFLLRTNFMKIILLSFLLSGCSSMSNEEWIWQGIHAIDAAQTLSLKNDSCLEESNFLTKNLIGKEPNTLEVTAWWLGSALAHYFIADKLPPKLSKIFQYVSIGAVTYTVADNHNKGMRPFGISQNDGDCR